MKIIGNRIFEVHAFIFNMHKLEFSKHQHCNLSSGFEPDIPATRYSMQISKFYLGVYVIQQQRSQHDF